MGLKIYICQDGNLDWNHDEQDEHLDAIVGQAGALLEAALKIICYSELAEIGEEEEQEC